MPNKAIVSRYKGKDVDRIVKTLERARDATQKAIDQFNQYRPPGNIKSLKSDPAFRKASGINELKKLVKLYDKFIQKLLDGRQDNLDKTLGRMGYRQTARGVYRR